jgi:hypothetical protein
MKSNEKSGKTPIGVDVGTSRIVIARQATDGLAYDSQLNAFVSLPYSKLTENALTKEQVPHAIETAAILVPGNHSERFADLLHSEVRRPMRGGVLNPGEPESVRVIRQITASLLGDAQKAQKLCFTVPAAPLAGDTDVTYHEATLKQILQEMGFEATSINEGLAVIYSELADTNYTGIGVSFGGGLCNVCFAYLSVPVLSFSIAKAGDFIDSSAATATGELANSMRIRKEESFHLNGHFGDKFQHALGVYYDEMIRSVVSGLKEAFAAHLRTPKIGRPIPLVLSGGSALPPGFRDRFEKMLTESDFAVPLSEIRLAADPLTATAKGALVAALSEM